MTAIDELLSMLADCPPGERAQIDDAITPRLRLLIGKPRTDQATGIKTILDECAYASLATDFGMMAMDGVWKMAIRTDSTTA